jgi:quercetin dioxygenase-like cupin family protein
MGNRLALMARSESMTAPAAAKHTWSTVPLEQLNPALSRRIVTGKEVMVAQVYLKAGCVVPKHHHVNEQVTYILQGALRLWVGDKVDSQNDADGIVISTGELLVIPSNVPHRAIALEDTLDLDVFAPPRQDWLNGTDEYLRKAQSG